MYEGDAPLAERRAAALALDRDLLRELLGDEDLRELLDPAAFDELELSLQHLLPGRGARNVDDAHDLLRTLGDLSLDELTARSDPPGAAFDWAEELVTSGRAIHVRVAGEERLAAVEDAARLRDALGVTLPIGLPGAFTEPAESPLEGLVWRFARTHAPFTASAGQEAHQATTSTDRPMAVKMFHSAGTLRKRDEMGTLCPLAGSFTRKSTTP
jgi:ATP-dependent Lhr-like helicase